MLPASTLLRYLALAIVLLLHVSEATSAVRAVISTTATGGAGNAGSKFLYAPIPTSTSTSRRTALVQSPTSTSTPPLETTATSTPPSETSATPAPYIPNNSGDGLSPELKMGLGIGLGIGLPLIALLGLGCFFLWRLWGRQNQHQSPVHNEDREVFDYPAKERGDEKVDGARVTPKELQSTELYEADGEYRGPQTQTSPTMRPVELNA
ncbi:hypothetical protein PG999_014561 [Apiospora kogelbergensis]|uniref:Uncharacterized protein n=1 Tax=Apiospora kogelbergensis TaxID=1337665 RepID=A0AAW0Q3L7_9PEZI